jgi:hypothetical protein
MPAKPNRIETYEEFWKFYLRQHAHPATKMVHALGLALALVGMGWAAVQGDWLLIPVCVLGGYAILWTSHFVIEHNLPATWTYPLWSLKSEFRMVGLWLLRRL